MWDAEFEAELIRLLDTEVLPEVLAVRDRIRTAYEGAFGRTLKRAVGIVTPTLTASLLSGLSAGQVLALSSAAVTGAISISLSELVELWQDQRTNKRNGLSFLLSLRSKE